MVVHICRKDVPTLDLLLLSHHTLSHHVTTSSWHIFHTTQFLPWPTKCIIVLPRLCLVSACDSSRMAWHITMHGLWSSHSVPPPSHYSRDRYFIPRITSPQLPYLSVDFTKNGTALVFTLLYFTLLYYVAPRFVPVPAMQCWSVLQRDGIYRNFKWQAVSPSYGKYMNQYMRC